MQKNNFIDEKNAEDYSHSHSHLKYYAIIPAAGISSRMQAEKPKQYFTLQSEPILQRVVNLFSCFEHIEKVIVVLNAKDIWWPSLSLSHPEKIMTVIGGVERMHSVFLGLEFLKDFVDDHDFVLVHDAARPLLKTSHIDYLLSEIKNHEVGGLLGLPIVDTLKKVNSKNEVEATISREGLWQAQTPQCFRYGILKAALENVLSQNQLVTDESSAVEMMDLKPKMVLGSTENIKITYFEDIALVEKMLRGGVGRSEE